MLRTWNKARQNKWNVFVQDPGIKELVLFVKKKTLLCVWMCLLSADISVTPKFLIWYAMFRIAFQLKNPLGVVTVKFTENTVEGNDQRQF